MSLVEPAGCDKLRLERSTKPGPAQRNITRRLYNMEGSNYTTRARTELMGSPFLWVGRHSISTSGQGEYENS